MSVSKVRTDLALEAHENMEVVSENTHGITVDESYHEKTETRITKVLVSTKNGAKALCKPMGTYITLETPNMIEPDENYHREISKELSAQLKELIPDFEREQSILVVGLGNLGSPQVVLAMIGLLIIGVLHHYKVKGDILIGILATWLLGIIAELIGWYTVDAEAGAYSLIPSLSWESIKANFAAPALFQFDFGFIAKNFMSFAVVLFTFLYTDIFDTVGTLIGVAQKGDLLAEDGSLPKAGGALMADAVGTVAGACLGTSTVTSYVESSAGVAAGGRTGLTALTTDIMFLIAIPFAPIFLAIPGFATTPAMLFVGLLMLSAVTQMDFDTDVADAIGGFLAVVMMPFAYSIATGIMFAMIAWVVLKFLTGKAKDISPVMWISVVLFAIYIYTTIA